MIKFRSISLSILQLPMVSVYIEKAMVKKENKINKETVLFY